MRIFQQQHDSADEPHLETYKIERAKQLPKEE